MTEDPGEDPMPNLFGPAEALPWMDLHGPAIPIVSARLTTASGHQKAVANIVRADLEVGCRIHLPVG